MGLLATVSLPSCFPDYTMLHFFPFSIICRVLPVLAHMLLRGFLAFSVKSDPLGHHMVFVAFH